MMRFNPFLYFFFIYVLTHSFTAAGQSSSKVASSNTFNKITQSLPEQDCLGAIPLCQNVYTNVQSYSGSGTNPNEINPATSCLTSGEKNDVWYIFTVQQSGNLSFTITPANSSDDYDWAVFNLTNSSCSNIFSNPSLQVSCNYDANIGCGGATGPNGNTSNPCGQCEPVIAVQAGETYVVNVSNYSSSQNGYTINFSASSAVIADQTPPQKVISSLGCTKQALTVNMPELIDCNTIASSGSDFVIYDQSGNAYPVVNAIGIGCSASQHLVNQIQFNLGTPISNGTHFYITVQAGNDGNTIADKCGNFMPDEDTLVDVSLLNDVVVHLGNDTAVCPESSFPQLNAQNPFASGYAWTLNGSITGNNLPIIQANDSGTYVAQVIYGQGCSGSDTIHIGLKPALVFDLGENLLYCDNQPLPLLNCGITSAVSYSWKLNGNPTGGNSPALQATSSGLYTLTINPGNMCPGTDSVLLTVVPAPQVNLGPDLGICNGDTLTLDAGVFSNAKFNWLYNGSPLNMTSQLISASQTGIFSVIVSYNLGCSNTDQLKITNKPLTQISLGNDLESCYSNPFPVIHASTNGFVSQWSYNNFLIQNGLDSLQTVGPGNYIAIAMSPTGCRNSDTLELIIGNNMTVDLGKDTIICSREKGFFELSTNTPFPAQYTWQLNNNLLNANSPSIVVSDSGIYTVLVSENTGCTGKDTIAITFENPPIKPNVSCPENRNGELTFTWENVTDAEGYEISENEGLTWINPSSGVTGTTHTTTSFIKKLMVRSIASSSCRYSDAAISEPCDIYINNMVTPNGDGSQDFFTVSGQEGSDHIQLQIFDHLGKEIFTSSHYQNNWNGLNASNGVYYYKLKLSRTLVQTGKFILLK